MRIGIEETKKLLREGNVVAVPTDTVYGLAVLYDDVAGIDKIFALKGRPQDRPLTVIAASVDTVIPWVVPHLQADFLRLAEKYWPGALTIVVETVEGATSDQVRRGKKTTGLRVPNQPELLALLKEVGPLVNPSANRSGEPPANSPEEVEAIFGVGFPIMDVRSRSHQEASTVVQLDTKGLQVLRQGAVRLESGEKK